MARNPLLMLAICVQALGLQSAGAEDMCGQPRSGQYATERICVSVLSYPDGKPAPAAMLDSVPDEYPWLFPFAPDEFPPKMTISVTDTSESIKALQVINGWAPYDTTGAKASQFEKFSRVKEVLIETSSGQSLRHTLQDTGESQFLTLPQPAPESWARSTLADPSRRSRRPGRASRR